MFYVVNYPAAVGASASARQLPIYCVQRDQKLVSISFDAAWGNEDTQQLIDILGQYNVPATFFVVGKDTEQSRQWMKQIVDEGHAIGVHSYTHSYRKIYDSVEAYLDDFAQEYHIIEDATGQAPQIFRFPGGSVNAYNKKVCKEIAEEMTSRGFIYYDWNASMEDAVKIRIRNS